MNDLLKMGAEQIIETLFPGRGFKKKIPATAFAITRIEGITVEVISSAAARVWGKTMRVYAFCPRCHKRFAFSRLKQHAPSCKHEDSAVTTN
jgi:hypothetical protein